MLEVLRKYNVDVNWEEVGKSVEQEDVGISEEEKEEEEEVMYTDDYYSKMKLELNLEI